MGVGKTTIGQQLANAMEYRFVDSDREIEARTGANIPLIFELEGEDGFRKRETTVISEMATLPGIVLATGGGAVIKQENRLAIQRADLVLYLTASIETLLERTNRDRSRPLLQTDNPRKTIEDLIQFRHPLYQEVSDYHIQTDTKPTQEITQDIIQALISGKLTNTSNHQQIK